MIKKDIKFEEIFDINDYEIETPDGWKDISKIGKTIEYDVWKLEFNDGTIFQGADEHILYLENGTEIFLKDIKIGDRLKAKSEKIVTNITKLDYKENMYDIEVDSEDHQYYTDDLVSHNTLFCVSNSADYLVNGHNVLYVTLEVAENIIARRIDANLYNINMSDLKNLTLDDMLSRTEQIKRKTQGNFFIKEYPTSSITVNHIRQLLHELKVKKNFIPEVIVVDYIGLMLPIRNQGVSGEYTYVKRIAEELRGLFVEFDVGGWSPTQTNRTGYNNTDLDMDNIGESYGLNSTTDLLLGYMRSDDLDQQGKILVKEIATRYRNDSNGGGVFTLGVDIDKMKLYDDMSTLQNQYGIQ